MDKVFENFEWKNYPSEDTPLDEINLNKINDALDAVDDRVILLDNTKATKLEVSELFKEVSYDDKTGIIKFTRKNGATVTIDTPLEKIALNIYYDPETEKLILPLIDETQIEVDLSRLITEYEFEDTDTIAFSVSADGKVSAIVKEGSIEEKHLRPNYLAEIKIEANKAQQSATQSESYAHGGTESRNNEDKDNAKYYSELAKEYGAGWRGSLLPQGAVTFSNLPTSDIVEGYMYEITNAFTTDARFEDGIGYSFPAGTHVYWTANGKWKCLSGILTKELKQAEYDALTQAEKLNGTIYYISDADNGMSVDSELSLTSINPVQNKVITEALNDKVGSEALSKYSLATEAGHELGLNIDENYVMTLELKNVGGKILSTKSIDFPIESMVINASYASGTLTLLLQNGQNLDVDISSIVGGLVKDSFTIAGLDMKDDIAASELANALGVGDKLDKTGDASNATVTFTQASERTNISAKEKLSGIFGKIAKWFSDLKTVAFSGSYNDLSDQPSIPKNASDIGAVSKSGDTMTGPLRLLKGSDVTATVGKQNEKGYIHIATIKIKEKYSNYPIHICIWSRAWICYRDVYILFNNVDSNDPELNSFYINKSVPHKIALVKSAASTWELYVEKSGLYDEVHISNIDFSDAIFELSYPIGIQVSTLPNGYIEPTVMEWRGEPPNKLSSKYDFNNRIPDIDVDNNNSYYSNSLTYTSARIPKIGNMCLVNMAWDNSRWGAQFAIENTNEPKALIRGSTPESGWDTNWLEIITTGNIDKRLSGFLKYKTLTQSQYDALSEAEKMNGTLYFIN